MAGEPAITKVVTALATLLSAGLTGQQIFPDRDSSEPLSEDERPGIVPRVTDMQFSNWTMGLAQTLHEVTIELDLYENGFGVDTINNRHAVTIAEINRLVMTNEPFQQMLQECELTAASGIEEDIADAGAAVLAIKVAFLTPRTDWTVINGHAGDIV